MTTATAEVLPYLPQSWLDGINAGEYKQRSRVKANRSRQMAWIKERPASKGDPCKVMAADLEKTVELLEEGGSAHDRTNERVYRLIALAYEGHRGLFTALKRLSKVFTDTVSADRRADRDAGRATGTIRSTDEARREFQRMWTGAVNLMLGNASEAENPIGEGAAACSCWDEPEGLGWSSDGGGSAGDPYSYPLTDIGNAEQIRDMVDGKLVWSEGLKSWLGYNEETGLWDGEGDVLGVQAAMRLAPRVMAAAEQRWVNFNELEKAGKGESSDAAIAKAQANKLSKHAERCGSRTVINAALELMQSLPGVGVDAGSWNANPRLLGTGDGNVIELNDDGVSVRPATEADRLRKRTAVPYVPGATDPAWTDYLDTFIPDLELRAWVQQLFGYALYGGNPERALVFLHGDSSTGKSTIVEAVGAAIGDYGGTFDLSVFRQNLDAGGRPDIVRLMGQRVALASETSFEHPLHNDQLKRLTGGDRISARMLYGNSFVDSVPQFTPFVATNATPRIEGADQATWRRILAVPFDEQVDPAKDDMTARDSLRTSPAAQAAVLAWCVSGWEAYVKAGRDLRGNAPREVSLRTMSFRESVSDFHQWLAECTDQGPTESEGATRLFDSYKSWCAANSIDRIMSLTAFGRKLTGEGFQKKKLKVDGSLVWARQGLRLAHGVHKPDLTGK